MRRLFERVFTLAIIIATCAALSAPAAAPTAVPAAASAAAAVPVPVLAAAAVPVPTTAPKPTAAAGWLKVHFIDVGQADSILVQTPAGDNLLIDGGNRADGPTVTEYLRAVGVRHLTTVIATHPHEDHIGGFPEILKNFSVTDFFMPKVSHTTDTFKALIEAVLKSRAKRKQAKSGVDLGLKGVDAVIIAPASSSYKDFNDWSAVVKLTYGKTSFMLTGDAGIASEFEMLIQSAVQLSSTVLKVAHHGSSDATSDGFLDAVNPAVAVISVGLENPYGHPHKETLDALASREIKIYRTDQNGTIVAKSDGTRITMHCEKPSPAK